MTPNIFHFNVPVEVMVLKNLALLRKKEQQGQLTAHEKDMLHETIHHNELCMYYSFVPHLKQFFTGKYSFSLDMNAYVKALVKRKYNIPDTQIDAAVDCLLEDAYQTIDMPVNDIYPTTVHTGFGDVVLCLDLRDYSLTMLDQYYVGFLAFYSHLIRQQVPENDIIASLEGLLYNHYTYGYQSIKVSEHLMQIIAQKAAVLYTKLVAYTSAHMGG